MKNLNCIDFMELMRIFKKMEKITCNETVEEFIEWLSRDVGQGGKND